MAIVSRLASLLRHLFHRGRVERDLDDELRAYLDLLIETKRLAGLSEPEARRAALLEIGGIEQVKESVRAARPTAVADELRRDLTYALRLLGRNKGFATLAIATLAIGIGASTAIFTVADAVVFRALPYADPARLVKVWSSQSDRASDDMSWADFADLVAQQNVFERAAADDGMGFDVRNADGSTTSVSGASVSAEWLTTLGVPMALGRPFLPEEFQASGRDRAVILAHAYWQRRFGGDPAALGRTLVVDDRPLTIVGVLPPNVLRYGADFLRPLVPADYPRERSHRDLDVFARLKPGVTLAQAQASLDVIGRRLAHDYPATNAGRGFHVAPLGKYYASVEPYAERGLVLMLGAVALLLLVACANVTNLLLARALTRSRECVVRAALGASRGRLVRQMLVETSLLVLAGGALGVLVARWSVDGLLAFAVAAGYVPERLTVAVDARVLAFSFVLSLVAGALAGIGPALQASRIDLAAALTSSGPTTSGGYRRTRVRRLLVVAELAIALVLLVGSGLLIRSVIQLRATASGVDAEHLLLTASDGGRDFPTAVAFWRRALDRTRELPGVRFAAVTSRPPVHGARGQRFFVDGQARAPQTDAPRGGDILISADYFRTAGIPLLQGRAFTDRDAGGAPPVAIISQSLARRFFPDGDALGRRLRLDERTPMTCCSAAGPVEGVWREIVGVAADVRQDSLEDEPAMTIYRPFSQIVEHDMYLMVRAGSPREAAGLVAGLRAHLLAMDPARVWDEVRPMDDVIDGSASLRLRRFVLTLIATFGSLSVLLAAAGAYGVMARAVAERTREIGIRMALGATRPAVLADVFGEAMRLTGAGLVLGTLAALAATPVISTLLFGVSAADTMTYVAASLVLATVALLASYVPARRAARIDPLVALRQE